jgi:hypothetical protein
MDSALDGLFRKYRDACGEPEATPQFMPSLWARIEAERDRPAPIVGWLTRWFAGFAAAASVALLALTLMPTAEVPGGMDMVDTIAYSSQTDIDQFQSVAQFDDAPNPFGAGTGR